MKGYYTAKRILANVTRRDLYNITLVINSKVVTEFELRPREKDVWALCEENDGYHVVGSLKTKGNIILAYLKLFDK